MRKQTIVLLVTLTICLLSMRCETTADTKDQQTGNVERMPQREVAPPPKWRWLWRNGYNWGGKRNQGDFLPNDQ